MKAEKERLIGEAYEIAGEIGSRGFVAKWMVDQETIQECRDPAVRERELLAFWHDHWKKAYPGFVKAAEALSLSELMAYRIGLQDQLAETTDFHQLFDHYGKIGAIRRARSINQKEEA